MPRTLIAANANGAFGGGINNLTFTAGDQANGMYLANQNWAMLVARNQDVASKTVTVASVTDQNGRTGDIVLTVPAASGGNPGLAFAGPFRADLFQQRATADLGRVHVNLSADTNLALAAIQITP